MATLVAQRATRTLYSADGSTTLWNFNFTGGYLDKAHVKATARVAGGADVPITLTEADFVGPYQISITPAVANGSILTIYRDTPKDLPLVDFADGSGLSETALDINAKQAVFIAAEFVDLLGYSDVSSAIIAAAESSASAALAVAANTQAQLALNTLRGEATTARFSGNGVQVSFPVTQPNDNATVLVYIGGIYQQTNTYTLTGGNLAFSTAPVTGTNNIEVVIQTALPVDELSPLAAAAAASAADSLASANASAASALASADASRLTIGTVTTGAAGSSAVATIVGSAGSQTLNLTLPRGDDGADGAGSGDMTKAVYDTTNNGKVDLAEVAESVPYSGVTGKPTTFAPSAHTHVATDISNSTTVGRAVMTAADAAAARTAIGAGIGNGDGYINVPQNAQSTAYTCVLADAGRHLLHPSADTTARTFTIPANASVAYQIGTALTFVNQNGAGVITIAITTDTMRLAGAGTTGSRSLAANGMATALKLTATEWIISGTGLT